MGKKSKANRNKATVATTGVSAVATATVATTTAYTAAVETKNTVRGKFPESTCCIKAKSFFKKGNCSKAKKIYSQGIERGCVPCMHQYVMQLLFEGSTEEDRIANKRMMDMKENHNLHLVLPLALEGAIRGSTEAISSLGIVYSQSRADSGEEVAICDVEPDMPVIDYWMKHNIKNSLNEDKEKRTNARQACEGVLERIGRRCCVCHKKDSDTVTLRKCDGCKYYYYCSTDCQRINWEGQHAGVCRHLGLLKKYHKPFARKIWTDLVVHGIAPTDIPELVELRHRLGLSRPQADYQELLDGAQSRRLDPAQLILPRKDGTVQIGSFPRPM